VPVLKVVLAEQFAAIGIRADAIEAQLVVRGGIADAESVVEKEMT